MSDRKRRKRRNTAPIHYTARKARKEAESGGGTTLTASVSTPESELRREEQRREQSGIWYPIRASERCRRKNCKFHSVHPSDPYGCDYFIITQELRTEQPTYRRYNPPSDGCTLYEPAPAGWHELRVRELRKRESEQMQAAKTITTMYASGIYHDYSDTYNEK